MLLPALSPGQRAALSALFGRGATESALAEPVVDEGVSSVAEWYGHLDVLQSAGLVEWVWPGPEGDVARLVALSAAFRPRFGDERSASAARLSPAAVVRRDGDWWIVESPAAEARVEIAGDRWPDITSPLLTLLGAAGLLEGESRGDARLAQDGWAWHDALFHFRSRLGRRGRPDRDDPDWGARVGAVREADDDERGDAPPDRIALQRCPAGLDLPPLDVALGRRRSARHSGEVGEIGIERLGWWLDLVAADTPGRERVRRSYPSGGACYPLELFVVVARCAGLATGGYRYEPATHALDPVGRPVHGLLEWYRDKAMDGVPPVLTIVTYRPARVNRRYRSIAYSLVLKEVGGLFQTMYLVAAGLELSACAIGGGDNELIGRTLGLDPIAEPAVGEFALGG